MTVREGDDAPAAESGDRVASERPARAPRSSAPAADSGDGVAVSFEDSFEAEAREVFGDLGPAAEAAPVAQVVRAAIVAGPLGAMVETVAAAVVTADLHSIL